MSTSPQPEALESAVLEALERHRGVIDAKCTVGTMQTAKGWALGSAVDERGNGVEVSSIEEELAHHGAPQSWLWIARLDEQGLWSVRIEWTPGFYDMVSEAPSDLLPPVQKALFQSDGVSVATAQVHTEAGQEVVPCAAAPPTDADLYTALMLPWRQGESWRLRGGPHGWGGCYYQNGVLVCPRPWSSLDLNGRDNIPYEVKAAGNGLVTRPCLRTSTGVWLKIKHGNGWDSHYYHLDRVPAYLDNWAQVWRTTLLGWTSTRIDCDGAASGPHVHFAISYNGEFCEWNGRRIGGWTIREGPTGYEGAAERADFNGNVRRARARTLDPLYNMGVRFQVHMQNLGWMAAQSNFTVTGQPGSGLRMEAIRMALQRPDGCPQDPDIAYQVHVQNIGWQAERRHDEVAGTEGQSLRIEAIRIRLVNPPAGQHVAYKVWMRDKGWGPLTYDWGVAGTTGESRQIEGIQIGLLP